MRYDATKLEDVKRLGRNLLTTPTSDCWKVIGHIYDLGLMRARGPMGWAIRLAKWRKGTAGVLQFFKILSDKAPDAIQAFMFSTYRHVLSGRDTEDKNSAGGWSQREIDLFTSKVSFSADTP